MTREEALNEIKSWDFLEGKEIEAIETLIPELAESEDERAQKRAIAILKQQRDYWSYDGPVNKFPPATKRKDLVSAIDAALSCLEKQKELKFKVGDKVHLEGDDVNILTITGIEKDRYLTDCAYSPILFGAEDIWEKVEQKPAELSGKPSRQEYLYHLLANGVITFSDYEFLMRNKGRKLTDLSKMMVHKEPYIAPVPTPMVADEQKPVEWTELQSEFKNINEAFEDGKKEVLAHPEKYGLCEYVPAEWSDEDSDNLERVDNYLWMLDNYVGDDCATPQGKVDKIRENIQEVLSPWLKSLPERFVLQPKQEWSEEDEKMRNLAIDWAETMSGQFSFVDMDPTDFRKIITWLKSLPERFNLQPKQGYEQAEKGLGWISVKDRLPEVGHFVLTCVDDSGTPQSVGMALLLKNGTWWDGDMKVYVDYWMEVPKLKE